MSTGDEILPEHLNLPDPLAQIDSQIKQIFDNGSAAEKDALKQLLANAGFL
ncbi:hypothetical protein D3C78_1749020 [compost metagenome]